MAPLTDLLPNLGGYQVLAVALGILGLVILYQVFLAPAYYPMVPRVGEPPGRTWFSLRTRMRYYTDCAEMFIEAYQNFAKKGQAVLVPAVGLYTELVLPEQALDWAMAQPDSVLSVTQAFLNLNQTKYSLGHEKYWGDPWQFTLVKMHLNSILQNLIPVLNEELQDSLEKHFGTDTENWKEIPLEHTIRKIVAQASSRFIVGETLCRNEEYLQRSYNIIDGMMANIYAVYPLPKFLRPLVAPFASWYARHNIERVGKLLEPLYRERLQMLKDREDKDPSAAGAEPQDLLHMMLKFAQKKRPHELNDLHVMARRVAASSFVSMHQTTIAATNMLLNVIGTDPEYNTIAQLREEVVRVLGGTDSANWTKDKFANMLKADSLARETMRLNFPFGTRGSMRKVMKDCVVGSNGMKLHKGTIVSFLAYPTQVDPEKYDDPAKFDPFRFSREHETGAEGAKDEKPQAPMFVTTSPHYLPFGHGKHACPGRFMVDLELKMMVAYVLTFYDIDFPLEYGGKQPPITWVAELSIPPPGAKIRVKRRKL